MDFIESDCIITLSGQSFKANGAYLVPSKKNGLLVGGLYMYARENKIGTWHGDKKVAVRYGKKWVSRMGDTRCIVYFTWEGKRFYGTWYASGGDYVSVRELKS